MLYRRAMQAFELGFIKFVQEFRNPVLDEFFKFLNYFDRVEFLLILTIVVWIWFGWRLGLKLLCLLIISRIVNISLKELFGMPRPYDLNPALGLIRVYGFGFPSGSAQTAALLSGFLVYYWKNNWKWVVAPIYFFMISFSRIYLGVHFPLDILGGWIVGFSLLAIYIYTDRIIWKSK